MNGIFRLTQVHLKDIDLMMLERAASQILLRRRLRLIYPGKSLHVSLRVSLELKWYFESIQTKRGHLWAHLKFSPSQNDLLKFRDILIPACIWQSSGEYFNQAIHIRILK